MPATSHPRPIDTPRDISRTNDADPPRSLRLSTARIQRGVRTLRLLVGRSMAGQDIARSNAAEASATLRRRRRDHDEVGAYLHAWRLDNPAADSGTRGRDSATDKVV